MARIASREIVFFSPQAVITNSQGAVIVVPMGFTSCIVGLDVQTVSGTTPTLNVYVQNRMTRAGSGDLAGNPATGLTKFQDFISFTQLTTSNQFAVAQVYPGGNVVVLNQDATLTAGNVNNGPLGVAWRVKWVVGGTTPSFFFSVVGLLIP